MVTPTAQDTADVDIVDPAITLDKTASKTQGVVGVDPLQATAGVNIFYAFKATNTGDVPLNNCQVSDPNLGGNVGAPFNLPNNGDMATVFSVAAKQYANDFQNTGTVTCDNVAMVTPTATDTADVNIVDPMLTLDKTASETQGVLGVDPLQVDQGTDVFYAYKATNTGDVPLNNCQVTDNLLGSIGAPFNLAANGGMNTVFTVIASQINQDTQNLGTVTCDAVAMVTPTAQDTADVFINKMPGVKLMKIANPDHIEVGETVTYTFDATNTGDVALFGCNINDDKLGLIAADFTLGVGESKPFQSITDIFVNTKNTAIVDCLTGLTDPFMVMDTAMATVTIIFVGGEFLPIDSTALFVSGIQTSAVWILPAVAGLAGTGYYLIRFRAKE